MIPARTLSLLFGMASLLLSIGEAAATPTCTNNASILIGADFQADYTCTDLGAVSGLPTNYGGMVFAAGDPNTILIGGAANTASGGLFATPVTRDASNHIVSVGAATRLGDAPYNDGGFAYGPGGVLFLSQWPVNKIGEYKPGNTAAPDKVVDTAALGVAGSQASLGFVPAGFAGAGRFKGASWSGGQWYDFTFAPDGSGTFDITAATFILSLPGGPEGFVFVSGANPDFGSNSLLIDEYSAGKVGTYALDANGDPILATRRDFITGLTGAEGAAIDPLTGDFVFSTFGGGNHIVVVQGFTVVPGPGPSPAPEPATVAALGFGLVGVGVLRRRRR
jgi:hypothetical protein